MTSRFTKPDSRWFVHDRFGMFIHWGLYAMPARHEWIRSREEISIADYQKHFEHFDPDLFDPIAWARMAKRAGMEYFVITTKHHDGFCMWPTVHTDYCISNTPYQKDLIRMTVDAFRAEGIKVGFYYSLIDWHHPEFTIDRIHPMRNNAAERARNPLRDMRKYAEYMRNQVLELCTQYGKIDLFWFDFSYPGEDGKGHQDWQSEELYAIVQELQPHALVDNRLDLPDVGDFVTPEQFQPAGGLRGADGKPVVWEACQTFSGSWGYYRDEHDWKSVDMLVRMLVDGVSKGGNLLLNVGPTARGLFDQRAIDRLEGIADWMRLHSKSIYGCGAMPDGMTQPTDCRYTYNAQTNRLYLHIFAWPFRDIYCPGLGDQVAYAQFLHDGSEVHFGAVGEASWAGMGGYADQVPLAFQVPIIKPDVVVPVIEIFLK